MKQKFVSSEKRLYVCCKLILNLTAKSTQKSLLDLFKGISKVCKEKKSLIFLNLCALFPI